MAKELRFKRSLFQTSYTMGVYKKLVDKSCSGNIKTIAEKHVSSENIYILILLDETFLGKSLRQTSHSS